MHLVLTTKKKGHFMAASAPASSQAHGSDTALFSRVATVFKQIKQHKPNIVFFISRACDDKLVIYEAQKIGQALVQPVLDLYTSSVAEHKTMRVAIQDVLRDNFFGISQAQALNQKNTAFKVVLAALPERHISVVVKRSGNVIARGTVAGVENATIINVHLDMQFNASLVGVDIPYLRGLTIHATAKGGRVLKEYVKVTPAMLARVDVVGLMSSFARQ